jgi:propionate CoA-transferase
MDPRIFRPEPMDLRNDLIAVPLAERFSYDAQQNTFFINFERLSIRSLADVEAIRDLVTARLAPLGRNVYAIVNYENFDIAPELIDAYGAMVKGLVDRFYSGVTRYTTSNFLRVKLGDTLRDRGVAPHIYESADEARTHLRELEQQVGD